MTGAPHNSESSDRIALAMPGFGFTEGSTFAEAKERDPDPSATFTSTSAALRVFLGNRDPVMFLARTGLHLLQSIAIDLKGKVPPFEQAPAELLQSIALTMPRGPAVPTSPGNMERGWELATRNLDSYLGHAFKRDPTDPKDDLSWQARLQTLHYRNIFNSEDAKVVVPDLLARLDPISDAELGYRLSDFARAIFAILDVIAHRVDELLRTFRPLFEGSPNQEVIAKIRTASSLASRAWRYAADRFTDPKAVSWAAFQLSELVWAQAFTFSRKQLESRFGSTVTDALFEASIAFGELEGVGPGSLYLDSPIRRRPFIRLSDTELFAPVPALAFSFPFEMIEEKFQGNDRLEKAYYDARKTYLEDATADIVGRALPSATIYQSVHWNDPDTGVHFENDVVAKLGNHIFIFEAKSGKLKRASRRGGLASLLTNFDKLYVEPGRQAARLEALLARGKSVENILKDRRGKPIMIDLSRPVVVHSFGICIEHFAAVTSNRRNFEAVSLLASGDPWSPILSLGDLRMLSDHLDTEVSFFHYCTRRPSIERMLDFVGDEQDLLSVYLTNGFQLDSEAIRGTRVFFNNADTPVRGIKKPRPNRREFATPGVDLPRLWKRLASDLYATESQHKFDMLETLFNMHPAALQDFEERVRRWKNGLGTGDKSLQFLRIEIGDRTYALGVLMQRDGYLSEEDWKPRARAAAAEIQSLQFVTDCVIVLKVRRSKASFDAISFYRSKKP